MASAFSRSRVLLARYDVSPHMVKWWGKVRPDNGQIVRSLSPFEQHSIMPWLKTFPRKMMDRAPNYIIYFGGSMGSFYGISAYADEVDRAEHRSHRF
mmetsp:Transcript_28236/g.65388  ORF Transcript_28236/g.65388 Transcript_28236/m.65388 type:complete len:97 (+) Transcript_28236:30-320(+)